MSGALWPPDARLRELVRERCPRAFLRVARGARADALYVCDAPRHGAGQELIAAIRALGFGAEARHGLLLISPLEAAVWDFIRWGSAQPPSPALARAEFGAELRAEFTESALAALDQMPCRERAPDAPDGMSCRESAPDAPGGMSCPESAPDAPDRMPCRERAPDAPDGMSCRESALAMPGGAASRESAPDARALCLRGMALHLRGAAPDLAEVRAYETDLRAAVAACLRMRGETVWLRAACVALGLI